MTQTSTSPLPGADFTPADLITITTAEQLKAISDPLRLEIIECISLEALTVKQIAARLKQPPTKLYYHVSALEEAGFVVVVETRLKANILEKYYRLAAQGITVDRSLLKSTNTADDPVQTMITALFDSTVADLRASLAAGLINLDPGTEPVSGNLILSRSKFTLRPDQVRVFMEKFSDILKEMTAVEATSDTETYSCTIAFYPSAKPLERKKHKT